jgi:hypothetical protein
MQPEIVQKIAVYIAVAVPVTVAIGNLARIVLEWLNQRHKIKTTVIEQTHNITAHYLDRALDPQVPLALRHQLLRFLATSDPKGDRLRTWAQAELERVGSIVQETNRAVENAEKELNSATTPSQVEAAERKLTEAVRRQRSLMEPPIQPSITAAALRAGLIAEKQLNGLEMKNESLKEMQLNYRELRGADFSESDLTGARLQGCDLRAACFRKSNLTKTVFYEADLRGANFQQAILENTDFHQARLEGADLRNTKIEKVDMRATYDESTQWPEGFNPDKAGAVRIGNESVNGGRP